MRAAILGVGLLLVSCRFDSSGIAGPDRSRGDLLDRDHAGDAPPGDGPGPLDQRVIDVGIGERPPLDRAPDSVNILAPFGAPTPVAALNTSGSEDDPTLRGDMLEIFFERDGDIWTATRSSLAAKWGAPQKVSSLSSGDWETNPEIVPDGLTIFFASDRTHPSAKGNYDIYVSTRSTTSSAWSAPAPVVSLNTDSSDHPAPAPDLLTMIVISDRPGGLGEHDLFISTRPTLSSPWGVATPLVSLNTVTQEASAWLDATTLVTYFASSPLADQDIFLSTRPSTSHPFATPINVTSLNSTAADADPWLSPDLRTIYFSSTRDGTSDIFVAQR